MSQGSSLQRFVTVCSSNGMVRRTTLAVVCGALLSCHMILGMDDLDVASAPTDAGGFDWDFDAGNPEPDAGDDARPTDAGSRTDADVDGAATRKRVFVTSDLFSADFGDEGASNAKCQAAAEKAQLGGEWVAWLSRDGKRAIEALTFDGRYELLDGGAIATDKAALIGGTLLAPIDMMEDGKKASGDNGVWTGTLGDGNLGDSCSNWTDKSLLKLGTMGSVEKADKGWTARDGQPLVSTKSWQCSQTGRLYCFEK